LKEVRKLAETSRSGTARESAIVSNNDL